MSRLPRQLSVSGASDRPARSYVNATITVPQQYLGRVIELLEANRGEQKSLEFFDAEQVILVYDVPAAQLVDDLFGKLKGFT